jgi:hypothetical protein
MSQPEKAEQIRISTNAEMHSFDRRDDKLAQKWRLPWAGLSPFGSILALFCTILPLLGPSLLHRTFIDQFWSSSFTTPKGQFLSSFVSIVLWEEDHGYPITYLAGIALAFMSFMLISRFLEYFGLIIFREND